MKSFLCQKRYLILAALLLALGLCGCEGKGETPAALEEPEEAQASVRISEWMAANTAFLRDADGDFSDWIELENYGEELAVLDGCWLSDEEEQPMKWRLPRTELMPGQCLLLFASGKDKTENGEIHTNFKLSQKGESLYLSTSDGEVLDKVSWPEAEENHALCRAENGELTDCLYPTPGRENTYDQWLALCAGEERDSPLLINEAMSANGQYLPQNGKYYDWVELKNISDEELELSEYYLSDDEGDYFKCRLPELTLAPGQCCVLLCTDAPGDSLALPSVSFKLDSSGEKLFLSHQDRTLCDWCVLLPVQYGHSVGRMTDENGMFCFQVPSPGEDNGDGERSYAQMPEADIPSGVYEAGKSFSVSLSGEGEIHYTLDGRIPDGNSSLYDGTIQVENNTVIRAVSCVEGKLNSPVLTLSYILDGEETMDVISIAADPEELLGDGGVYYGTDKEREVLCSISFLEKTGGFSCDGGLTLHGNSELNTRKQKGLQLNFHSGLSGCPVYDLFGEEKEIHSLLLRTGISREYYFVADVLYTELAQRSCSSLMSQSWRYVSVYINGEYWGLYQLRDRFSCDYFADLWKVSKDSVAIIRATELYGTELGELISWVSGADMRKEENYTRLSERMDMESLAEWFILQAYSGNTDTRTNVKWVKSDQYDGKWYILLYDLDRAMNSTLGLKSLPLSTAQGINELRRALFQNKSFQTLMLEKLSQMLGGELTTENTQSLLEALIAMTDGQMQRSLTRWGYDVARWESGVDRLKKAIEEYDMPTEMVNSAISLFGMSTEETAYYFGDRIGEESNGY